MKYKTTKCYLSSCYFIFLLLLGMLTWINGVSIHFSGKRRSEMQYAVCVISVVTEKKKVFLKLPLYSLSVCVAAIFLFRCQFL